MGRLRIFNPRTWRRVASSGPPEARTIPAAADRGKVPTIFDPEVWRQLARTDVTPRRSITRRRTRCALTVK